MDKDHTFKRRFEKASGIRFRRLTVTGEKEKTEKHE